MGRHRLVVAVWKEKLTHHQSVSAAQAIVSLTKDEDFPFASAVAPNPFSYVDVAKAVFASPLRLCAQNILFRANSGSYIAETTIEMLQEIGCDYVIVGHSERRLHFGESNDMIANRALAAVEAKIRPILCIGDTATDRAAGRSKEVITGQLSAFFDRVPATINPNEFLIAYEPVWAISTWRNEQPLPAGGEVQELHNHLREMIAELKTPEFADQISLLYGGSVDPLNGEDYMSQPDVDGALVGGASKTPDSFVRTLKAAELGFKRKINW
jgi:triosephosphate isomerase